MPVLMFSLFAATGSSQPLSGWRSLLTNPYAPPSTQPTPDCTVERCPSCKCEIDPPNRKSFNLKFSCSNCDEKLLIGFGPVASRTCFLIGVAVVVWSLWFDLIYRRNSFMPWGPAVYGPMILLFYVARYFAGSVQRVSDVIISWRSRKSRRGDT